MKNKDLTLRLFDVKEEDVERFHVDLVDDHYEIDIFFKSSVECCKNCGSINFIGKGNHKRKLVSTPVNERPCFIFAHLKRYRCKDCNTTFISNNPIAYKNTKFTRTAVKGILKKLKHYSATYSEIARNYGVSSKKISDLFDELVDVRRNRLPRVLLLDEFFFGGKARYKYPAILMDFETGIIVDIVESRRREVLDDYFFHIPLEERKRVEFICTDMSFIFKPTLKLFFKDSTLLVDHFHVTKLINDQLNNTRKRIMSKYSHNKASVEYRLLKHRYKLLLKQQKYVDISSFKRDAIVGHHITQNGLLERILDIDDDLKKAYRLKEEYLAFDQSNEKYCMNHDKKKELLSLIRKMEISNVPEFMEAANTLRNWQDEIVNSFSWFNGTRITNGALEGKNNYVKKILSNANGMINFRRARNRIMYSQNKKQYYHHNTKGKVERPGKLRGEYKKKNK